MLINENIQILIDRKENEKKEEEKEIRKLLIRQQ